MGPLLIAGLVAAPLGIAMFSGKDGEAKRSKQSSDPASSRRRRSRRRGQSSAQTHTAQSQPSARTAAQHAAGQYAPTIRERYMYLSPDQTKGAIAPRWWTTRGRATADELIASDTDYTPEQISALLVQQELPNLDWSEEAPDGVKQLLKQVDHIVTEYVGSTDVVAEQAQEVEETEAPAQEALDDVLQDIEDPSEPEPQLEAGAPHIAAGTLKQNRRGKRGGKRKGKTDAAAVADAGETDSPAGE